MLAAIIPADVSQPIRFEEIETGSLQALQTLVGGDIQSVGLRAAPATRPPSSTSAAIINANGAAVFRTLEPDEYRAALHAKLAEASEELRTVAPDEQMGEPEVPKALAIDAGHTLEQVIDAANVKMAKRGGFTYAEDAPDAIGFCSRRVSSSRAARCFG